MKQISSLLLVFAFLLSTSCTSQSSGYTNQINTTTEIDESAIKSYLLNVNDMPSDTNWGYDQFSNKRRISNDDVGIMFSESFLEETGRIVGFETTIYDSCSNCPLTYIVDTVEAFRTAEGAQSYNSSYQADGVEELDQCPPNIGDTCRAVATITKKYTKQGKSGELKFLDVDTKVYNQNNEIVTDGEAQVIVM